MVAPDTSTGQLVRRVIPMPETPPGSGNYEAQIPPLAPLHGTASVTPDIQCQSLLPFVPTGGDESGGSTIFVTVPGTADVTGFAFGGISARAFHQNQDRLYVVTSPAGTGDVPLAVTFADGTTADLGTFHYLHVDSVSSGSAAGDVVTVTGSGFTDTTGVLIGTTPATKVTYVSPTQLDVTLPASTGSQPVTVVADGAAAAGPKINYGAVAVDGIEYIQSGITASGLWSSLVDVAAGDGLTEEGQTQLVSYLLDSILEGSLVPGGGFDATLLVPEIALDPEGVLILAGAVLCAYLANQILDDVIKKIHFDELIDPSGTVVDHNGTPVSGATVTLARKNDAGEFVAVPAGSNQISPSSNPETTTDNGLFDWDAIAGTYMVAASSTSCTTSEGGPAAAQTAPFALPPPALGLILTLPCQGPAAPPPTVTGVDPSIAPATGGNTVVVSGTNLAGTSAVTVGGKPAAYTILSANALSVIVPSGTDTADVLVTTPSGVSTAGDASAIHYYTPPVTQPQGPLASTTQVSTPKSTLAYGEAAQITAAVTGSQGSPVPTGTVTFSEGNTIITTATLDATGKAVIPLPVLAVGSHTITAAYSGDSSYNPSQDNLSLTVTSADGSLTLTSSESPAAFGDKVTVTAKVAGAAGAAVPTGTVNLAEGNTTLGSATLDGNGSAAFSLPQLPVGTHTLTATYSGDGSYKTSSGSLVLIITQAPTRTSLSASPNPAAPATPVTLTAQVTSGAGNPSGTVTFTDGSSLLGKASVSASGQAVLTVKSLTPGDHQLSATYSGAASFASSTATTTLTVLGPSLSIKASELTALAGETVTITGRGTGLTKPAVRLAIVESQGSFHRIIATCDQLSVCTTKVKHSAGSWTYRIIATDRTGKPLIASDTITVTWERKHR